MKRIVDMFMRLESCVRVEQGGVAWSLLTPPEGQGHEQYVCIIYLRK